MESLSIDSTRDRVGLAGPLCLVTWTAIVVFLSLPASAQTLPLAQLITVDVPAVQASGDFLLDGAPTPPTSAEIATTSIASSWRSGRASAMQQAQPLRPNTRAPACAPPCDMAAFTAR